MLQQALQELRPTPGDTIPLDLEDLLNGRDNVRVVVRHKHAG